MKLDDLVAGIGAGFDLMSVIPVPGSIVSVVGFNIIDLYVILISGWFSII